MDTKAQQESTREDSSLDLGAGGGTDRENREGSKNEQGLVMDWMGNEISMHLLNSLQISSQNAK